MALKVDLNADMGESYGRWTLGDDEALMPQLTSANIACGFHGGDPHVMRKTVALALEHGVGVGAHVAFPDLIGFGRRRMAASPEEVADYVVYQAGAIRAFVEAAGGSLQHVKPHGALYTTIVDSPEHARAVAEAVASLGADVILLMPPDVGPAAAAAGIPFVPEGYVDLDYDAAGKLVLERVKQLRDPQEMAEKALRLARDGTVRTIDGGELRLQAESICVHGDAPNAPEIARAIRETLEAEGIELAPLTELRAPTPAGAG
ncbi:MAG TPA: 5-oxoprolinase subunit PxpA [Gaiellaceae bacterium]|nr:5-oxoprolinase subunit PxpA [Gaiellaceae bacterium]